MSTTPEITHEDEKSTNTQNQETISKATPEQANKPPPGIDNLIQPTDTQNQQQNTVSSPPEIKQDEAKATNETEPVNPPYALDDSAQSITSQNQQVAEITPEGDVSTPTTQATNTKNQETLSTVPEITPEEATSSPTKPAELTTETTERQQKSDLNETPKQETAPAKETPTVPDSTNITPRTDKTYTRSKKDSICFPLPGFYRSKEKKSQSKKPGVVQDTATTSAATKDEHFKPTDPQKQPILVQDSADTSSKDEHSKPTEPQKKPVAVQDSATTSSKDEHSKPTDPQQKPDIVQDSATTSTKDEHSKPTDPQKKPVVVKGTAITSSKIDLSKSIDADIKYIEEESNRLDRYKDQMVSLVNEAKERFEDLKKVGTEKEFRDLKKEVTKLKLQIPAKHKADADEKDPHKSQQASGASKIRQKNIPELVMKQMPQLYKSSLFEDSAEVRDFEALFHGLSEELKLCLLCFSVFPEKAIIKKRLMVYWWMAEGFVPPIPRDDETRQQIANGKTAEEFADEYLQKLTKMGFIEPVNKKRSLFVGCYTLHPFVRLALIMLAEKDKFFNFDEEGKPTEKSSGTFQACLVGRGLIDFHDLQEGRENVQDLEKLHAVFNVNEPILDFKPEWFLRMRNLNVLYLGRWKVSATDHIEVEEINFLDGLTTMNHLKFFSLQGVSRVMELPDSISQLSNLIILDLRACHSLESIPEGIQYLRNLTYLDMSECYLLEHMPKGLAMLSNLRVLKGFVVGEEQDKHTCTLDDLAKWEKLIKLCIYTGLGEFPTDKDLNSLQNFKVLQKLTMAWGGGALHTKSDKKQPPKPDDGGQRKKETPRDERKKAFVNKQSTFGKSLARLGSLKGPAATSPLRLEKLEKLDLKSFPKTATPSWLMPSSLKSLKKLYIRGGKFSDLGQYQDLDYLGTDWSAKNTWKVEILRLKYLSELEMDWRELQELFPNLIYLEKVNCPKLTFFPSDGYGVWINKEKLKQMQVRS